MPDSIPGNSSTTASLALGASVSGDIEIQGDVDWYRVTLPVGDGNFHFTLTGAGGQPLNDPFLTLYGPSGTQIASDDDSGPAGDASLYYHFNTTSPAVVYIAASGFGTSHGGYTLTATQAYQNPLATIDWGATLSSHAVRMYFARAGETAQGETATRDWTDAEKAAAMAAAQTFSNVADLQFSTTTDRSQATIVMLLDSGLAGTELGSMTTPDMGVPAVGLFNPNVPEWSGAGALNPGGQAFTTLLHEFGHALGLAHPHDNGGSSEVMQQVSDPFSSYGYGDLNEGIYTIMSYNDGWARQVGGGPPVDRGSESTPMALDIALLQAKYGAVANNAGDTVYDLGAMVGHSYASIWDTGGTDTITYSGASSVLIDLRPATLDDASSSAIDGLSFYEPSLAGGGLSFVFGFTSSVAGGYTIAHGSDIENAFGGNGGATLVGNGLDNWLVGGAGVDSLIGGAGNDRLEALGGSGDLVRGEDGDDIISAAGTFQALSGGAGNDRIDAHASQGAERINGDDGADSLESGSGADTIGGGAGDDIIYAGGGDDEIDGGTGNDWMSGGGGNDRYHVDSINDVIVEAANSGRDTVLSSGSYMLSDNVEDLFFGGVLASGVGNTLSNTIGGDWDANLLFGGDGNDTLFGSSAPSATVVTFSDRDNDTMFGGDGFDQLYGGVGNDILNGGDGGDTLDGGAQIDTADYSTSGAVTVRLGLGAGQNTGGAGFDTLVSIENLTGSAFDDILIGDGGANVIQGGNGADRLTGGDGADMLDGGGNIDTAIFSGAMSAYTLTTTSTGLTVTGPDGSDALSNIELLQFSDQTFHFRPGTAATVDFTASPSTYAGALRDFDGNDLGGGSSWVLAGHADVQGDGDQEYILFNQQIGRWATIGPAADGRVYFDDHGWAGDTRVVGIYIDPEVQQGHAALGGPNDSQRRFQNDLNIGNIKGILGAGDYNHDGLQEVYFSLTDGTAYLHAYMHADGNIEYANYQDQTQVTNYLTANGFASSTWIGWF
ncbi:MAG: family beta-propeller repeat protein [Caulobacteraceae bacterium]|nr:family beta-propeller repeat protein [Caulobacteraceae bacterium]